MSEHAVALALGDDPVTGPPGMLADVTGAIRAPSAVSLSPGAVVYTFIPDLTPAESATFDDLVRTIRARVPSITLVEYQALKSALSGLRQYHGLASPTNAQSVAAIKAIIEVLRALLRD